MALVEVEDVSKSFHRGSQIIRAVQHLSVTIESGRSLGIVGESGSGKSTLARLILRLLLPDSGTVRFGGVDLAQASPRSVRRARAHMQAVFQEPYESLDPEMSVRASIEEPLAIHERNFSRIERLTRVNELLGMVGLREAYASRLPGQLSGGEQQRVGIARAIATRPKFVVLDEPTSSLDLSTRAGIISLLLDLQRAHGITYCFVSHDIATTEYMSDEILVMYGGQMVELGPVGTVLSRPEHPYTKALLAARLSLSPSTKRSVLPVAPDLGERPESGCVFYGRCPIGSAECGQMEVPAVRVAAGHVVRCLKV